jgi:hypothetical protein
VTNYEKCQLIKCVPSFVQAKSSGRAQNKPTMVFRFRRFLLAKEKNTSGYSTTVASSVSHSYYHTYCIVPHQSKEYSYKKSTRVRVRVLYCTVHYSYSIYLYHVQATCLLVQLFFIFFIIFQFEHVISVGIRTKRENAKTSFSSTAGHN